MNRMNLQENIQRIREIIGVDEQLLPTTGTTNDISTEKTNSKPIKVDATGTNLKIGIQKLFNNLKTNIFNGVSNVNEFLKKISGKKKRDDLIPTGIEHGQVEPPVESKINDNTQINEKYENITPIILNTLNNNLEKVKSCLNFSIESYVTPNINSLLSIHVNKGYGNSFNVGSCPFCYEAWWNVNIRVILKKFNINNITPITKYKETNIVEFTIFGDLTITSGVNAWENNWINTDYVSNISFKIYIDPIVRNIQICIPNITISSSSIDLGLVWVRIYKNKLNVYNRYGDWNWNLPIQSYVNRSFKENPMVLSLSSVSPDLDKILKQTFHNNK